jgi:uracil-DNA glycosylase
LRDDPTSGIALARRLPTLAPSRSNALGAMSRRVGAVSALVLGSLRVASEKTPLLMGESFVRSGMTIPEAQDLDRWRAAAETCKACPLWRHATQTVFGEGSVQAPVMLVGEQPGNEEDLAGQPFVGPAGVLLVRALADAGIDRGDIYVTNAVKHFKWEPRGKRRIHKTPAQREIEACHQWLQAEIDCVKPRLIVCLGATAARAVLGYAVRIGVSRGLLHPVPERAGPQVAVTYHPAYVLRQRDPERFAAAYGELVEDLRAVARVVQEP